MNKRQARRIAYNIAYRFVQQALDGGGDEAAYRGASESDQKKIDAALDSIAQQLFERSELGRDGLTAPHGQA
jgi:hypothetical protein